MTRVRLVLLICATLLGCAGLEIARADVPDIDALMRTSLVPSAAPALLGPVDATGRKGWKCVPEQAAKAQNVHAAELPQDPG